MTGGSVAPSRCSSRPPDLHLQRHQNLRGGIGILVATNSSCCRGTTVSFKLEFKEIIKKLIRWVGGDYKSAESTPIHTGAHTMQRKFGAVGKVRSAHQQTSKQHQLFVPSTGTHTGAHWCALRTILRVSHG